MRIERVLPALGAIGTAEHPIRRRIDTRPLRSRADSATIGRPGRDAWKADDQAARVRLFAAAYHGTREEAAAALAELAERYHGLRLLTVEARLGIARE